jgi:peptidoglycan/xylan/chitin deacetylase (PgdA/CDA1 family)
MMIVVIMLLLSLALAPEIRPLRFTTTTAFGQNSYLSNQLLSSFLSENQNKLKPPSYFLSPLTGINGGDGSRSGIGTGSSSSINNASNDYSTSNNNNNNNSKLVILTFDDGFQTQYTYVKPILDKYNFKASFFVVCNYAGKPDRMSWQEITTLHNEGYDVESHSMNHNHMNQMTPDELSYEIGQSKQCLADHGINATIFAYPFDIG